MAFCTAVPEFHWWVLLVTFISLNGISCDTRCGDYLRGSAFKNDTSLIWPSDSSQYKNGESCIWLLEAKGNFSVHLVVNRVKGESGPGGECKDYVEVRDGGTDAAVLFKSCNLSSAEVLLSTSRWMTIKFVSDQNVTNTGFNLTFSSRYSGVSNITSPVKSCQGFNKLCRNRVCVGRGYLCDGLNDCGCTGPGCDEEACGGLNLSEASMVGVGVAVGCVSFVVIFAAIGILEWILKRRSLAEKKREAEEEEKRKRRPKPRKKTSCLEDSLKASKANYIITTPQVSADHTGSERT